MNFTMIASLQAVSSNLVFIVGLLSFDGLNCTTDIQNVRYNFLPYSCLDCTVAKEDATADHCQVAALSLENQWKFD